MSVNRASDFIKGGGDADREQQPGDAQIKLQLTPLKSSSRPPKPKSVFNQYRSRKPAFVSSWTKGTTTKTATPNKVQKASSMEDLTPERRRKAKESSRAMSTMALVTPPTMDTEQIPVDPMAKTKLLAGRRIFQLLVLNAWRKRKSFVVTLIAEKDLLSREMVGLQLQVKFLRKLLEGEKDRSNLATAQLKKVTAMLDDVTEEITIVRKDKEEIYMKLACQDLHLQELEAKFEHVRNELQTTKSENCVLLDKLHSSEHEVLCLNDKNKELLVQVAAQDENMTSRAETIKDLQTANKDLDKRLSSQLTTLAAARQEADDARKTVAGLKQEVVKKTAELSAVESVNAELLEKIRSLLRDLRTQNYELEDLKVRLRDNELEIKHRSWSYQIRNAATIIGYILSRVVVLTSN